MTHSPAATLSDPFGDFGNGAQNLGRGKMNFCIDVLSQLYSF